MSYDRDELARQQEARETMIRMRVPLSTSGPIALTDGTIERARIASLECALRSLINAWKEPGPMGTVYQMPRAVSHAESVLLGPPATIR